MDPADYNATAGRASGTAWLSPFKPGKVILKITVQTHERNPYRFRDGNH